MKLKKKISFHHHSAHVKVLPFRKIKSFLQNTLLKDFGLEHYEIRVIFYSLKDIHEMNQRFLGHDYATDVITFDLSENELFSCEMYICPDVVRENARQYSVSYREELLRVIIHGLLHCLGYDDGDDVNTVKMRNTEDKYISLYANIQKG